MSKKYICMQDDCAFCTSDEEDAFEHAHMRHGHSVVEVDMEEGGEPSCHLLEIPSVAEGILDEEES
jgi:hypothetical protein